MRLIDADELKKIIEVAIKDSGFYRPIYQGFAKAIDAAPTIDAVPIEEYLNVCKERDAVIADMSTLIIGKRFTEPCDICKHKFGEDPCQCIECYVVTRNGNFEWRGIDETN